jgi:AcrR family transcriptional regulator
VPSQQRSRERLERILGEACTMIAEAGSDALKMSELAARSDVSIGSLYQYFPDKSAVIRTLAERYNAQGRECIGTELSSVRDLAEFQDVFGKLVDTYYALFLAEPVMRDIWSGMQADNELRELELAESRANGELLAATLQRIRPEADPKRLHRLAFLIMSLGESTMRMAISVGRAEGDDLVEAYKQMVLRELQAD